MRNRIRLNNGRASKLKCPTDYNPASFADFLSDLKNGTVYVDIVPNNSDGSDAGVSQVGTALNMETLLDDDTATELGLPVVADATPNDAFLKLHSGITDLESVKIVNVPVSWSNTAPYSQTIAVDGVLATDNPLYSLYIPDTATVSQVETWEIQYSMLNKLATGNGSITLTCFSQKPTQSFSIILKGK